MPAQKDVTLYQRFYGEKAIKENMSGSKVAFCLSQTFEKEDCSNIFKDKDEYAKLKILKDQFTLGYPDAIKDILEFKKNISKINK